MCDKLHWREARVLGAHYSVRNVSPDFNIFCYCTDPYNSGQQPDDGIDPRHNRLELEVLRCLCKVKELLQESFVHWRQKVKCTDVASADFLRWSKIFVARAHLWHAVNYWTELSKYCQSRKCLITQRSPIQQVLFANDGNQLDGLASCKGDCPYNIFLQRIVIRWMGRSFAKKIVHTTILLAKDPDHLVRPAQSE